MDRLKTLLDEDGVEYSEIMFESSDNVADLGDRLFVSVANNGHLKVYSHGPRVYVKAMISWSPFKLARGN